MDLDKSKHKQQCKIKNQLEGHWFVSFRSFIDLPQAIYCKSDIYTSKTTWFREPTPSTRFLEPTTTRILESTATRLLESATARFLESTTTRSLEPTKWPTTKSAEQRTALQKRCLTKRQSAKCGTKTSADSYTTG